MKVRVFTLRFDSSARHFDDTELCRFMEEGVEVIEVRDHVLTCDGQPVLVLLVSYRPTTGAELMPARRDGPNRSDIKLSADEAQRFEAVRAWRNARAQRDGKPPYVLLTNRQLAAIARCSRST